ncbi:MAG: hypothetical protein FWE63_01940 [Bacteroidales bacterium]|nr:hypothetical protein [Bacteroidales bacterium]
MNKDWTGNRLSPFATLGASSHSQISREQHDYYATEPLAAEWLIKLETLSPSIWECAAGEKHISNVFENAGYNVWSTDLIDRGAGCEVLDFLQTTKTWDGDIITNPPYKHAQKFVEHALSLIPDGRKVCMFLKVLFLESQSRKELFEKYPPKTVWVSSKRLHCAKNGDFTFSEKSAMAYAWFVWEKGFCADTTVKWFN